MRLTRRVFDDLAIWMVGVGVVIGIVFPPMMVVFGVPREIAITPFFYFVCLLAGILVGGINVQLTRVVVMPRLRALVDGMQMVQTVIEEATFTGDWSRCDPQSCQLPVDSDDIIGESAAAFNHLMIALKYSHDIEDSVAEFTKTMTSQLELGPLCDGALSGFMAATNARAGAILGDVGGELSVLASFGIVETARLCANDHVRRALQTREPIYVELPEGLVVQAGLVEFQPREVAFLPLSVQSRATGVVVLAGSAAFERESRPLSQIFARTFVMALANATAHADLQRIAALDPLTNCYNRRFGFVRLREEFTRAKRGDQPLGIILFDIDHFKPVNDTYGHLVGDRVLARVAQEAKRCIREGDVLLRYGGEEFVCILPGASMDATEEISERIRIAVEELVVEDCDQVIHCTVSSGYTSFPAARSKDETGLIKIVDDALYRAKESGRNRSMEGLG
jgi:diguanylate cyclase (GGDEF)-like protein